MDNPVPHPPERTCTTHLGPRLVLCAALVVAGLWGLRYPAYDPQAACPGALAVRIDPNRAPWWELAALPHIGRVKAERIVEFRTFRGRPFRSAADLLEVPGIGRKIVADLEPLLVFDP